MCANRQHHMRFTPFYCVNLTHNKNRLKLASLQSFSMLRISVFMLTNFGVMALFSSNTQPAHMVQNKSRGAESYALEVQSNGELSLTGVNLFVPDVPLHNLCPSMAGCVPCDHFQQTAS